MSTLFHRLAAVGLSLLTAGALAQPAFVNALLIDGGSVDASGGTAVNDGRLGYFSDIYFDPVRKEWWALSDRGPGGGTLNYETRIHRFRIDVDPHTGAISNFQVLKTVLFRKRARALDGIAPAEGGPLGLAYDPEGIVVHPRTAHLFVSDEYGPSLIEFDHSSAASRRRPICCRAMRRRAR